MTPQVTLPDLPLAGGCQCGAVRYAITALPLTFYCCHCTECQAQSGSAFGQSLQVRRDDVEITGTTACTTRATGSGREMEGLFCPACGSRILHRHAGGEVANVRAGTLDDTSWLVPAGHIWTRSRQPWVTLPADAIVLETQGDMTALRDRWREMTGQP